MYLLGLLSLFCGNYLLYLLSGKIVHVYFLWEIRLKKSRRLLRIGATFFLAFGALVFITGTGIAGGIFFGLFTYFLVACGTVMIRPLLTPERQKR